MAVNALQKGSSDVDTSYLVRKVTKDQLRLK